MSTVVAAAARSRGLLRILGLAFGIAVVVGDMVGVGIMRTPGPVAGLLGSPGLIYLVWLAIGIYILCAANTMAELATAIPKAGGSYVYVHRGFGDYLGFVSGWGDFGIQSIAMGYLALASSEFLAEVLPALAGHEALVAPALIAGFAALNSVGLRTSSTVQQLVSLAKMLLLLALVVAAFAHPQAHAAPLHAAAPAAGAVAGVIAIIVAMQIVLEVYGGFNAACYFTEETTDPARTVPRAMLYGVLLVIVVYLAVNAAVLHVLTPAELGTSKLAAGAALARLYGPAAGTAVALLAVIGAVSVLNTAMLLAPRILYGMTRDGLFMTLGGYVTRHGVPLAGLWLSAGCAMLCAATGGFETLYATSSFLNVFDALLCNGALFVLRRREPGLARPYRARGYPWVPGVVLLSAAALLIAFVLGNRGPSLTAVAVLLVTYPVFRLLRRAGVSATPAPRP
ncbi:MAG: APC family permease [Gammaproteobacteria bacterium]|nr:APC family permease [Gammaproteobacteria bacterium]